jgi:hypothetical protein
MRQKKRYKTRAKRRKQRAMNKPNQKSREDNKTLGQISEKGAGKKT